VPDGMFEESPRRQGPPGRPWSGGGREELAQAVRRLMELTVTSMPAPGTLLDAAKVVDRLADRLAGEVPEEGPVPQARFSEDTVLADQAPTLVSAMPFDMIVGPCNPLAPPIEMWFEPPLAKGRVVFTPTYEGAPGLVHGAALAAAFDIILTGANVLADGAGPTVELTIRYRKPTRIGVESEFESWVNEKTERRTFSEGRLIQDGIVTVEAVGEFVNMDRRRIEALHARSQQAGSDHTGSDQKGPDQKGSDQKGSERERTEQG